MRNRRIAASFDMAAGRRWCCGQRLPSDGDLEGWEPLELAHRRVCRCAARGTVNHPPSTVRCPRCGSNSPMPQSDFAPAEVEGRAVMSWDPIDLVRRVGVVAVIAFLCHPASAQNSSAPEQLLVEPEGLAMAEDLDGSRTTVPPRSASSPRAVMSGMRCPRRLLRSADRCHVFPFQKSPNDS